MAEPGWGQCTVASAQLRASPQLTWRTYKARDAQGAQDEVALVARRFAQSAAAVPTKGSNALDDVLAVLDTMPLSVVHDTHDPTLWLFAWSDSAAHQLTLPHSDGDRLVPASEEGTYALDKQGAVDTLGVVAHARFLEAVEGVLADRFVASGTQPHAIRCAGGAYVPTYPCLVVFQAHTTSGELVGQMYTTPLCWEPLSMEYNAEERATSVVAGQTTVALLPSMAQGTYLGTLATGPTHALARLAEHLAPSLHEARTHGSLTWVHIRLPVRDPPWAIPTDPLDHRMEYGGGASALTIAWPAALCLYTPAPAPPTPAMPLRAQNILGLLESVQSTDPAPPTVRTMDTPIFGPGAPRPLVAQEVLEHDVYQGIGQLTEADFQFFDEPMRHGLPPATSDSHGQEDVAASAATPLRARDAEKGAALGNFAAAFPDDAYSSPRTGWPRRASSSASDDSDADDDAAGAVLACGLARLHSSPWPHSLTPRRTLVPGSDRALLAERAVGLGACAASPLPPQIVWPRLASACEFLPLEPPRLFLGCQRAVVEVDAAALDAWPVLGLEPLGGPKRVHFATVLVGDVDAIATRQWLEGLQHTYESQRMGRMTHSLPLRYVHGQLEYAETRMPALLLDALQSPALLDGRAVLVIHAPDDASTRSAEHCYDLWRMHTVLMCPRSAVAPQAVQQPCVLAQQVRALYDAVPRSGLAAPSFCLAPPHDQCTYLRSYCKLALTYPLGAGNARQHGAVMHIAYDTHRRPDGLYVRITGTDDHAQRTFTQSWAAGEPRLDLARIWDAIGTEMRASPQTVWHVLIARNGPMPLEEVHGWAAFEPAGMCGEALQDVVVVCLDADRRPSISREGGARPAAVHAAVQMRLPLDTATPLAPLTAQRTAYYMDEQGHVAWTVHLVQVLAAARQRTETAAYMADALVHLAAMHALTRLRSTVPVALPWPMALLRGLSS